MIPGDTRSPFVTSGIRIGTPAITTRGLETKHMGKIAEWIVEAIKNKDNADVLKTIRTEVEDLCKEFPVYK